jgi:hypothetical protein
MMEFLKKIIELLKSLFTKSGNEETGNVVQLSDNTGKTENTPGSNSESPEPILSDNIGQQSENNEQEYGENNIIFGEIISEKMEELILELKRIYTCDTYTIGQLYINGEYFCDTIEDADRGLTNDMTLVQIKAKKIYGETAIPTGTYEITMSEKSQKFGIKEPYKSYGGFVPRLVDVKGYSGVLIHIGNYASDSLGCILVGKNKSKGAVLESTVTFKLLMDKYMIPAKEKGAKISIKITSKY